MLLRGYRSQEIVNWVKDKWHLRERQAWEYIRKAQEAMQEAFAERQQLALAEHMEIRRDLRKQAYKAEDYRLVLEIMKDEAKLLGLYPKLRVGVSIDDVLDALPREFRDSVRAALADAVSQERD